MKNKQENKRVSFMAMAFLLLSMLLMCMTIPFLFHESAPTSTPRPAAIGISIALLIRLIILLALRKTLRESQRSLKRRDKTYLGLGILLILFGIFYTDGAMAFITPEGLSKLSILMFISVFWDLLASTMMFVLFFSKPQSE